MFRVLARVHERTETLQQVRRFPVRFAYIVAGRLASEQNTTATTTTTTPRCYSRENEKRVLAFLPAVLNAMIAENAMSAKRVAHEKEGSTSGLTSNAPRNCRRKLETGNSYIKIRPTHGVDKRTCRRLQKYKPGRMICRSRVLRGCRARR